MPAAITARSGKSTPHPAQAGFHPLRWLRRCLTRPLKIKRIGRQWHVVFDASRLDAPVSKAGSRGEALRQAHAALQTLLAGHDDARHMLPHLSHLEHSLGRIGSRALTTLPLKVLQRALDQLDMLEGRHRDDALMPLRLRVEEAVRQRTPVNLKGDIANVEVKDASVSVFEEAEVSWTNRMALDEATDRMALDAIYASAVTEGATAK
jgi:hypothetical protein